VRRGLLTTTALTLAVSLAGCAGPQGAPAPDTSSAPDASPSPSASVPTATPASTDPGDRSPSSTAPTAASTSGSADESAEASPPAGGTPETTTAERDLDSADSPTVVVNKARPLDPVDYAPDPLRTVAGVQLRAEAAAALEALRAEAAAAGGHDLTVLSGYRSYPRQRDVYAGWVDRHGGTAAADRVSARPGRSEHQTGLAVDVGDAATPDCDLAACFGQTSAGRWVAAHAHEYGFVIRYPAGAEAVTGFSAEPWHLRWLGPEAAAEVRTAGGVVETAFGLPAAPDYPG